MGSVWEARPEGVFDKWCVVEVSEPGGPALRVVADGLLEEDAHRIAVGPVSKDHQTPGGVDLRVARFVQSQASGQRTWAL